MGARITIAHEPRPDLSSRDVSRHVVRPGRRPCPSPGRARPEILLHSEKKRQTVTPLHFVRIAVKTKTHTPQLCNLSSCLYHGSSLLRFRKDSISMSTLQAFKTLMAVPQ